MTKRVKLNNLVILFTVNLIAISCTTYTITPADLKNQMEVATATEGTFVFPVGGLFIFKKVMNNGIRELIVSDKNGNQKIIRVSQRTQIRIHKADGGRKTFYFDTMFIHEGNIVGQNTHFFPSPIKPIPFEDIVKIELQ